MKYATVIVYNTLHPSCHTWPSLEAIDAYIAEMRSNVDCKSIGTVVNVYTLTDYGFGSFLKEIVI